MLPLDACISAVALCVVPIPLGVLGPAITVDWPGSGTAREVEFIAWDGLGREVANSEKRGFPLTLPVQNDPILSAVTLDLRAGGTRFAWIPAEALPIDLGGIFPPRTDAILWLAGK